MSQKTKDTPSSIFNIDKKKKKKEIYCQNCGKFNHVYKKCTEPITSFGIIAFKRFNINQEIINYKLTNFENENISSSNFKIDDNQKIFNNLIKTPSLYSNNNYIKNNNEKIKYLLVRRRDSLNYVEFIRGRYNLEDFDFIYTMFHDMTKKERAKIETESFESLWNFLWMNKSNNNFRLEYETSYNKYLKLKEGYYIKRSNLVSWSNKRNSELDIIDKLDKESNEILINLKFIYSMINSNFEVPEWGFAKGRRNNRERDIDSAEREFQEETGFRKGEYNIIHQLDKIDEVFIGSNNINYKHTYFIAHCPFNKTPKVNQNNKHQAYEVGDIGWFTFEECYEIFRPCDKEKRELLVKVNNVLTNLKFTEEDVMII